MWQGEAPSGFSRQVRGRRLGVGSGRAGRQSDRAGTGRERPSLQGRKELLKSAPAGSRRPASGGGAGPAPRAPGGQPAAQRASGCRGSSPVLGWRLRGLFLHMQAACPEPFSRAQNPLPSLGIVNKSFDKKCRRGLYLHFKAPFLTLNQVALFICPAVPEARASEVAECQLRQRPHPRYGSPGDDRASGPRLRAAREAPDAVKIFPVLLFSRTKGWRDELSIRGGQCCEKGF